MTHARLVLALLQDGDLSALEERLVVHLSLLDGFLGSELDVGVSIMFSRVNLPLGLVGHLLDRDGDTVDLSTVAEMLLEVFLGGTEVDILNEDGPFVRVISPRRCWNRSRGTAGFMLIYKVVRDNGIVPSSLACSYSSSGLVYRGLSGE